MFDRLRIDMGAIDQACARARATGKPVMLCLATDPLQRAADAARILTYVNRLPKLGARKLPRSRRSPRD